MVAALVIAPIAWLINKIGFGALVLAVVGVIVLLLVNSLLKKRRTSGRGSVRQSTKPPKLPSRKSSTISIPVDKVDDLLRALDRMDMTDYLGMAAKSGQKAKAASDAGDFDGAWRHFHEQKMHYLNHAKRSEFTPAQAVALEGAVHRNLANLLRIEGRHAEALVHCLYYFATTPKRSKTDEKQLTAYFNRSKIKTDFDTVRAFADSLGPIPNFRSIQVACSQWQQAA